MSQAQGAIKWALYMLALLVVGPLAAAPMAQLRDATGGPEATVLVGTSVSAGVLAGLAVLGAAAAVGLVAARLVGARHAMVAAGLVLAWGAWRSASMDGLMRAERDPSVLLPLSGEGALLGLAGIVLGAVVWVVGRGDAGAGAASSGAGSGERSGIAARLGRLLSASTGGESGGPASIITGLVAAGIVAWLVAVEPLKGQTIFAALLAGLAAGAFSRAMVSRDGAASPIPGLIAMAMLAAAAPASALIMNGGSRVVTAALGGELFALANVMPLDWLAGAFWGIPMGLAWAESMVERPAA